MMTLYRCLTISWLCLSVWSAALAAPPELGALEPTAGAPRSLVVVRGKNLDKARVVWDAGQPSERALASAVDGASMFSVPAGVKKGKHPVAIHGPDGRSKLLQFMVDQEEEPNALPRVDDISLVSTAWPAAGSVQVTLYVQGANIDVGATVLVDNVERPSTAHKTLINDLRGANPKTLAYPIRHYLSRTVTLPAQTRGSELSVQVRNESGELSAPRSYRLPTDPASLDSDGDGIPDTIELNGYDNGSEKVDLRALGADPFRKDVFVEVDVMDGITYRPVAPTAGKPGTFDVARSMFANAPILNPFGPNGINLFVDASGPVENWSLIAFQDEHDPVTKTASFARLREAHFTKARDGVFHYAIWAKAYPDGRSGQSDVDFVNSGVGANFFITMAEFPPPAYQTVRTQAETFVHELGHDLGQKHGGTNHSRYKPNYWSTMSYTWQLRSAQPDAYRLQFPTCTQLYYASAGTVEKDGKVPAFVGTAIDYSEGMAAILVGSTNSLSEVSGVCGLAIDWDRDGKISKTGVNAIVDVDAPEEPPSDYANWSNLLFTGPRLAHSTAGAVAVAGNGPSGAAGASIVADAGPAPGAIPASPPSAPSGGNGAGQGIAQVPPGADSLEDRLRQNGGAAVRRRTTVPPDVTPGAGGGVGAPSLDPVLADKVNRVQQLLNDVQKRRGSVTDALTALPAGQNVAIQYDLAKLQGAAPAFGAGTLNVMGAVPASPSNTPRTVPEVEYRVSGGRGGMENVVAVKAAGDVAATALRSGESPVALEVKTAGLSARQIPGSEADLPVEVTVAGETRQLKPGEATRFGKLEVVVQASSNQSLRQGHTEGPPYALRLRVETLP